MSESLQEHLIFLKEATTLLWLYLSEHCERKSLAMYKGTSTWNHNHLTAFPGCTLQKADRTSILLTQAVHFLADVQHFLSAGPCFRILCASCHLIGLSYTYIYICFCCIFLYTGDHMLLDFLAWSLDNPFYLLAISYLFRIWYIGIADGCRWVLHSHCSSQFH